MNTLNRKQRERQLREQLILDTAKDILSREGFANLTMERIAVDIEYSKGTIYNHFSSKEDIISALSAHCMINLLELFKRAANYPAPSRDRISAIVIAHNLYALLNPVELQNMQLIKSQAIRLKVSTDMQARLLQLEQQITKTVIDIVIDGMSNNELPNEGSYTTNGIVFGLWSMGYGSNLLSSSGIPFSQMNMCNPLDVMWDNSQRLLDSYQWQPLSSQFNITEKYQEICHQLFSEEMTLLNKIAKQ
ncbi:MAG: TetR/AcrR family transcriptional regulator [Gammaproteobacteria bacterium]|nr:TetR/AcrR family transcriptional regulator [Gammaproteobacteria bacterium]